MEKEVEELQNLLEKSLITRTILIFSQGGIDITEKQAKVMIAKIGKKLLLELV